MCDRNKICSADAHQRPTSCRQTLAGLLGPIWKRSQIQGDCRYLTPASCKEVLQSAVQTASEKPHSETWRPLSTTGGKGCCGPSLEPAPRSAPASLWLSSTVRSAQCLGSWTVGGGVCGCGCNQGQGPWGRYSQGAGDRWGDPEEGLFTSQVTCELRGDQHLENLCPHEYSGH